MVIYVALLVIHILPPVLAYYKVHIQDKLTVVLTVRSNWS